MVVFFRLIELTPFDLHIAAGSKKGWYDLKCTNINQEGSLCALLLVFYLLMRSVLATEIEKWSGKE